MEMIEMMIPITTHFNTPDVNGIIFDLDCFKNAIKDERFKELGGIPITTETDYDNLEKFTSVNPSKMIGLVKDIDDDLIANAKLYENSKKYIDLIKSNKVRLGVRSIVRLNLDTMRAEIDKIISFDLVSTPGEERD